MSGETAPPPFELDRRAVVRSFSRAAPHYEAAASLQRRVRSELLERLQYFRLDPQRVLDLGAGAGQAAQLLHQHFGHAQVLAIDIAEGMLRAMPRKRWPWRRPGFVRICADAGALPLAARSVDLIYSNLMLQWCDRPDAVFRELARVLKPGGVLLFSTFGPDTLNELRSAWAAADDHSHVSLFADMQQLADGLMRAGFAEPVTDLEHYRLHYPDPHALMRELKQLGARNATRSRTRGLTGRARMQTMLDAYERVRTPAGLPATFEVIFGAAFGGDAVQAGEFAVPLSAIRTARR
jgi:malonyl-CoA O-methyltransferase